MAIFKTICLIVNTLCCTLFQNQKIAEEDIECTKVDKNVHIDKIKDSSKEYSDARTKLSVPSSACNQMSIQESDGESSKENNLKGTINNTKPFCNCHIKQQQEQKNSDKESQIASINDKYIPIDNCIVFLLKLEEPYNASYRIEKIIQTSSTQSSNLQYNCSTDNSTLYMQCPKQEIRNTISKNRTYPLTSTKINSKQVKLTSKKRKRIAGIFCQCFK